MTIPPPPPQHNVPVSPPTDPTHVRVVDAEGRVQVARAYGPTDAGWVLLPDGQLAVANRLVPTDEPFTPFTAEALEERLLTEEFRGFQVLRTPHYLILYQSSEKFATRSARLLESLYDGLKRRFRSFELDVRDTEFPLVAVIYRSEAEFRARRPIAPDVQAYYEIISNRIFLYEQKDDRFDDPRSAALRQPQTVAHEGTHQILQNIGIHPRLAEWPPWLIEGLAELAAAPTVLKDGSWSGFSKVHPMHMVTIKDLGDAAPALDGSTTRYILTRETLSPTEYALAWALTHYLANNHRDAFLDYLRRMANDEPFRKRTPQEQVAIFEETFGAPIGSFDARVGKHLARLSYEPPPFYAITFEQVMPGGLVRRATVVSPSPARIREWLSTAHDPAGGRSFWQAFTFRGREQAVQFSETWLSGR